MKKSGVLAIATIFIAGLFAIASCDQTTSTQFEESFQDVKQVSAIPGASNVTMDLKRNGSQDSFFSVSLDGKSEVEGWCIEWNEDASFGLNEGTSLYSTKGHEDWNELNYFLSIKNELKANDPQLTFREIQVVIWSLIGKPSFDVDKISTYENISERIYKDGQPLFDVNKVKNIVSQVKQGVASQKMKGDLKFTVTAVLIENDGQTIMVEEDETFWAFGTDYCFRSDKGNQWGWAYGFDNTDGNSESTPLVAGAGQSTCPDETVEDAGGTIVGEVTIERSGDNLTLTLSVTPDTDYVIDVVHIDVDDDLQDLIDRINNNGGNVPPGQFPLQWSDDENGEVATEVTFTVDLVENGLSGASNLYFAIHGVSGTVSEN